MTTVKSTEKSNSLRIEGNKFYSERNFHAALLKYNESLCHAKPASENVGLGYANRSAVYFEMKLYEICIKNIDLARRHQYPEKNFEILLKREEKCKECIRDQKPLKPPDSKNFFKLSYEAHKKLPFIVNCLEVKCNEKYGRHIITNQSLKVGDIIAIEKPFCAVLLSESKFIEIPESNIYQRCSNCLKDNALDLFPCSTCCKAMYCSTDCQEQSYKRYHRHECSIMENLLQSGSVNMALRLFFIAISLFDDSIEKLESFLKENEDKRITIFDDVTTADDKSLLLALLSLMKSSKIFSLHQHRETLMKSRHFSSIWENHSSFIQNFLQRLCQIADLNFHGIFSGSNSSQKADETNLQQSIGSGALLFASLVNHSCANNVLRICVEGKVAFVVCRPVEKGAQLLDCYKANFLTVPKPVRLEKLLKEFGFICECEACMKGYPTSQLLNIKHEKILKFARKADEEVFTQSWGQAIKRYRETCKIMDEHHKSFPSIELCVLQKYMARFLLFKARPSIMFT